MVGWNDVSQPYCDRHFQFSMGPNLQYSDLQHDGFASQTPNVPENCLSTSNSLHGALSSPAPSRERPDTLPMQAGSQDQVARLDVPIYQSSYGASQQGNGGPYYDHPQLTMGLNFKDLELQHDASDVQSLIKPVTEHFRSTHDASWSGDTPAQSRNQPDALSMQESSHDRDSPLDAPGHHPSSAVVLQGNGGPYYGHSHSSNSQESDLQDNTSDFPPSVEPVPLHNPGTHSTSNGNVSLVVTLTQPQEQSDGGPNVLTSSNPRICPFCHKVFKNVHTGIRKRHLKDRHLPHSIRCPFPRCTWTGHRPDKLKNHSMKKHRDFYLNPEGRNIQIYDPEEIVQLMDRGNLSLERAHEMVNSEIEKVSRSMTEQV